MAQKKKAPAKKSAPKKSASRPAPKAAPKKGKVAPKTEKKVVKPSAVTKVSVDAKAKTKLNVSAPQKTGSKVEEKVKPQADKKVDQAVTGKKAKVAGAALAVAGGAAASKKAKAYEAPTDGEEESRDEFGEGEEDGEALLEEEDDELGDEGLPPWWKDDPTGIERLEDEEGAGSKDFDDSDEWTEDDEDWSSDKRVDLDEIEGGGDDDDGGW